MKKQTQPVSAAEIEGAMNSLKSLRDGMTFLTALTPKERAAVPRLTPGRLDLMETALEGVRENPGILLASIDLASYENDVRASRGLYMLLTKMQELCADLQDTLSLVGSEADRITQQLRAITRAVAKTKPTPGLQALAERLNPSRVRVTKEVEAAPTGPAVPAPAPAVPTGPASAAVAELETKAA